MNVIRGLDVIRLGHFLEDTRHRPRLWGLVGRRWGLLVIREDA
jgi:hypothetical protein